MLFVDLQWKTLNDGTPRNAPAAAVYYPVGYACDAMLSCGIVGEEVHDRIMHTAQAPDKQKVYMFLPRGVLRNELCAMIQELKSRREWLVLAPPEGYAFVVLEQVPSNWEHNPYGSISGAVFLSSVLSPEIASKLQSGLESWKREREANPVFAEQTQSLPSERSKSAPLEKDTRSSISADPDDVILPLLMEPSILSSHSAKESITTSMLSSAKKRDHDDPKSPKSLSKLRAARCLQHIKTFREIDEESKQIFRGYYSPFFALGTLVDMLQPVDTQECEICIDPLPDLTTDQSHDLKAIAIHVNGLGLFANYFVESLKKPREDPHTHSITSLLLLAGKRLARAAVFLSKRLSSVKDRNKAGSQKAELKKTLWALIFIPLVSEEKRDRQDEHITLQVFSEWDSLRSSETEIREIASRFHIEWELIDNSISSLESSVSPKISSLVLVHLTKQRLVKTDSRQPTAAPLELQSFVAQSGLATRLTDIRLGAPKGKKLLQVPSDWMVAEMQFCLNVSNDEDDTLLSNFFRYFYLGRPKHLSLKFGMQSIELSSPFQRLLDDVTKWEQGPCGISIAFMRAGSRDDRDPIIDRYFYYRQRLITCDSRKLTRDEKTYFDVRALILCSNETVVNETRREIGEKDELYITEIDEFVEEALMRVLDRLWSEG